jgi:hypothetical protein
MRTIAFLTTLALAAPLAAQQPVRVGVYDTRAIAVAYAHSSYLQTPLKAKMKEMQTAKAAGDTAKVKELDEWGKAGQRKLHFQGFGRVPVTDLLAHVKDRLPEVAARAGVQAIAAETDYIAPGVQTVDITLELVNLYSPSPRVLSIVNDMKGKPPLDLIEIEKIKH